MTTVIGRDHVTLDARTPPADAAGDGGGPVTVASPVANVLNGAADLIERNGWVQGRYEEDGAYCIVGAIDAAAECRGEMMTRAAEQARLAVAYLVGIGPTAWNDAPGRTQAEVVAALRAAAERAA